MATLDSLQDSVNTLTSSTTTLVNEVQVKKATLDASVADAESAQTGSQAARDTASLHKLAAEAAATSATSTASALTGFDLAAIAETKSVTGVDVFVYDTSKDSDGGAWRKRTQATSWYNEALNTATRGARKEFPAVAVIVAESNKVTIYDGDDPAMPMWRVFKRDTNTTDNGKAWWRASTQINAKPIFAAQGKLCIGLVGVASSNTSLLIADFAVDELIRYSDSSNSSNRGLPISASNNNPKLPINIGLEIVGSIINDVAMTVLPNAPIDPATGLPVPTIFAFTSAGTSRINSDGTVDDFQYTWSTVPAKYGSALPSSFSQVMRSSDVTGGGTGLVVFNIEASAEAATSDFTGTNREYRKNSIPSITPFGGAVGAAIAISDGVHVIANSTELAFLFENITTPAKGMVAYTNANYFSGYQVGDIKLATLSDTDDTNVVGAELVTNGTFDTNTASWTARSGATISRDTTVFSGGGLKLLSNGTSGANAIQSVSGLTVGKTYVVSTKVYAPSSNNGTNIGAIGFSTNDGVNRVKVQSENTVKTISFTFVATSTSQNIIVMSLGSAWGSNGDYSVFDDISVRLAEADRSVNNNGLQVHGTVTKEPVATGADLVAYSGFSASNYLEQPYNSDLDFGTGDFSIMGWVNKSSSSGIDAYISRSDLPNSNGGWLFGDSNSNLTFWRTTTNSYSGISSGYNIPANVWTLVTAVRTSGVLYFYANGKLITSSAYTNDVSFGADARLTVGTYRNSIGAITGNTGGSLALMRMSATAPSAEQIAKIYRDERPLFDAGSQCTIYGTSDAVTALAHDSDTNLLHAGTSSGRSVFQGLRRVSNTTDAVGTAISASNNLVVEE